MSGHLGGNARIAAIILVAICTGLNAYAWMALGLFTLLYDSELSRSWLPATQTAQFVLIGACCLMVWLHDEPGEREA